MILRTLMSGQMATRRRIVSIAGSLRRRRSGYNKFGMVGLFIGRLLSADDDEGC